MVKLIRFFHGQSVSHAAYLHQLRSNHTFVNQFPDCVDVRSVFLPKIMSVGTHSSESLPMAGGSRPLQFGASRLKPKDRIAISRIRSRTRGSTSSGLR